MGYKLTKTHWFTQEKRIKLCGFVTLFQYFCLTIFISVMNKLNTILYIILVFCLSVGFAACDADPDDDMQKPASKGRRTVLIYMCAENSLGSSRYHLSDSAEIVKGRAYIDPQDRLLMYIDDNKNPRLYQIDAGHEAPVLKRSWSEDLCSTSPDTMREILAWTAECFPAAEYGLVMWSHADGWIPAQKAVSADGQNACAAPYSWGIDVGAGGNLSSDKGADGKIGSQMDIEDMAWAIEQSGMHLKYIFFDACLMQSLEVAYALRHSADYVVASPIAITAYGANYTHQLERGLFADSVEQIVKTYHADITDPQQVNVYSDSGIVFAVVRTDALEQLAQATQMALQLSDLLADSIPDLEGLQHYHTYSSVFRYRPHYFDARIAMKYLLTPQAFAIYDEALSKAVVWQEATSRFWAGPSYYSYIDVDKDNYCGVAAFIPQEIYTKNATRCPQGDLNEAFLETAWSKAAGWHLLYEK